MCIKDKLIKIVLIIDLSLILLHIFLGQNNDFFNLDLERNLPTFYSGLKLILIGFLALFFYLKTKRKIWLVFSSIFVFIGFDEMLEIHERLGNYAALQGVSNLEWYSNPVFYWTLILSPFIISAVFFFLYFIKRFLDQNHETRKFF